MPDSHSAAVDHNDSVNLISFFKAILTAATGVECVKRLGSFAGGGAGDLLFHSRLTPAEAASVSVTWSGLPNGTGKH